MAKKKDNKPRQRIESCTDKQQDRGFYVVERTGESRHQRHITVTPIDYYLHRGRIKPYQWDAANMLFSYAVLANMTPGVRSASMQPTGRDGQNHTADTLAGQIDARKRVTDALQFIYDKQGKWRRVAVELVCIQGMFIAEINKIKTYKRLEFNHFIEGIDQVARLYRLL